MPPLGRSVAARLMSVGVERRVESSPVGWWCSPRPHTTSALAPPGHAERIRGGMLCTNPPSVRTRRDRVHPTPPHRPNDNTPAQCCRTGGRHFAQLLPRGVAPLASRICDQKACFAGVGGLRLVRRDSLAVTHFRPRFAAAPASSTLTWSECPRTSQHQSSRAPSSLGTCPWLRCAVAYGAPERSVGGADAPPST